MAEANQKRLYDHFVSNGMTKEAEALLKVYPHFAEQPKKVEKVKKDE